MKAKTIKAVLQKKFNAWTASIEDEAVRELVEKNTIITGGCIASMLLREKPNDFDVYFRNRETAEAAAKYYISRFAPKNQRGMPLNISLDEEATDRVRIVVRSAGIASEDGADSPYEFFEARPADEAGEYVSEVMADPGEIEEVYEATEQAALNVEGEDDRPPYRPVFLSTNAITLSDKVQIILRFYGEPDEIHANYDFVHCTNYWTSWDGGLVLHKGALESLLTKELRYVGSKYPLCSLFRVRKFVQRGWTINAGQILKMAWQVSELDLSSVSVLEDQLTGVDVAYFCEVVGKLKEKDPEKVNSAYLVEILDRMF